MQRLASLAPRWEVPDNHFTDMLLNYFRSAWRNIVHHKGYSAINIAGLGTAFAACMLIGLFVSNELSFDRQIPDRGNVYRLNAYLHYTGATPTLCAATGLPLAPLLKADHSEVEDFVRVIPATPYIYPSILLESGEKKIASNDILCTDTSFARTFGVQQIAGSQGQFLPDRNSIALTQSLARELFDNESALNRIVTLRVDDTTAYPMVVSNVIPDFSPTSHIQAAALIPIPDFYKKGYFGDNYTIQLGPSYVRLRPGTDAAVMEKKFAKTIHSKVTAIDMRLQPVADVHTGSMDISGDFINAGKIDGKYLRVFVLLAAAIFLIACANFVNLTLAIAAYRGKEVAMKKILGAGRAQIMFQVFVEAFVSVAIAVILSMVLAQLCLPVLNKIIGRHLAPESLYGGRVLLLYAAMAFVATLLAGSYPAYLIAASRIEEALRTRLLFGRSRTSLRNILVTGQFAIAVLFIFSMVVFLRQINYMEKKDLGFSYSQVVRVSLDSHSAGHLETMRSDLSKIAGVNDITYGYVNFGDKQGTFGVNYEAPDGTTKLLSAVMENGAPNYLRFFNMKIVAGRDFTSVNPRNEYIINESLARLIGNAQPVGKEIDLAGGMPKGTVVGVVKDFNYGSLHEKIQPMLIASVDFIPVWKSQLYIKVTAEGIQQTLARIDAALKPYFHDREPELEFLDEHFRQVYSSENEASSLIAIIGGLALTIACMGLLSLAAFVIVRRTKEIGIRKVLGASVPQVMLILSKEFIRLVGVAFLIGAPVAAWLMNGWLREFAYRIELAWWIFALAGIVVVGIALLTVSCITIRAARANPVGNLRSE